MRPFKKMLIKAIATTVVVATFLPVSVLANTNVNLSIDSQQVVGGRKLTVIGANSVDLINKSLRDLNIVSVSNSPSNGVPYLSYDYAYQILDMVNSYRKSKGLNELKMDKDLLAAAMLRAEEISIKWSHERPDGTMCFTACPSGKMMGENIAYGYATPAKVMEGWKASAGHNSNMLDPDWDYMGVGCYYKDGIWYWSQAFGYGTPSVADKSSYPSTSDVSSNPNTGNTWTKTSNGQWKLIGSDGKAKTGWQQVDNAWYYFNSNGIMQTGWKQIDGTWYLFNSLGKMQTGWIQDGGSWYYFRASGSMVIGWQQIDGAWYYFNSLGRMMKGWQQIGAAWYYFDSLGRMKTGWVQDGGSWYYFRSSGSMVTGWQQIDGTWYYFNSLGRMMTGWQQIDGAWYYFDSLGRMKTGWVQDKGLWYFLNASGRMVTDTWIGSYYIGSNGVMV